MLKDLYIGTVDPADAANAKTTKPKAAPSIPNSAKAQSGYV